MSSAQQPAIVATGVRKSFGETVVLGGVDLTVTGGTVFALLGPNGAGKTTMIRILSTLMTPDAGRASVAGADVVREPDRVRAAIGVTGQFSALDELLTGRENLQLMADLNHLGPQCRAGPGGRVARPVRPGRRRHPGRVDLLRRHAPSARPGHDAGGLPERDLPRRTDHWARPGQPPPDVGQHPRARRWRGDHLPHHPVPRRGRRVGGPHRGARPRADRGRGQPGRAQAAHPRRPCPPPAGHAERPAVGRRGPRGATSDEEQLELQVPADGTVASLRQLLGQLDDAGIEVEHLSIHTPNLDDVFFAVTGPNPEEGPGIAP